MKIIKNVIKKNWLDALIIIAIILISVLVRIPSFTLSNFGDSKDGYKDSSNTPYFHDMDSYHYLNISKDILNEKNLLEKYIESNKNSDDISDDSTKYGKRIFLPYIVSKSYKLVESDNISLDRYASFFGVFVYLLAIIPVYLFIKKKTNIIGGITGGIIAGLNVPFFTCSVFSCMDTDVLLCLLPIVLFIAFIKSITSDRFKVGIIYSIISSITLLALGLTWGSYLMYYALLMGLEGLFLLIYLIKYKSKFLKRQEVKILLLNLLLYNIIVILILDDFSISYFVNKFFAYNKSSGSSGVGYPSANKFILELESIPLLSGGIKALFSVSPAGIINQTGGIMGFLVLVLSFVEMIRELFSKKLDLKNKLLILMLLVWCIGGFISLSFGRRFLKIYIIPALLIIGLAAGQIYKFIKSKQFGNIGKIYVFSLCMVLWVPYLQTILISKTLVPTSNDTIDEISTYILENTDEDAIIASWWDFGYYYKYKANRKVLADGGTFSGRYYYFLAKALVTDDINLTKGIFRMLATNKTEASELADEYMGSAKEGCKLLDDILPLSKKDAKELLLSEYELDEKQINKLLDLTHEELESDIILVISEDMMYKSSAINYYGNYNFEEDFTASKTYDKNSIIYVLYYEESDYEGIEHLKDIDLGFDLPKANIWKISYD